MSRLVQAGVAAVLGIAAVGAIAATSSAPAPARAADKPSNEQCFYSRNINGFSAPDDHTVYIKVGVNDVYRLDLMGDCPELSFRQNIGLESKPAGDAFICSAIQADVVYRDTGIPQRCPVTAMHKLTPEELTALPKRDRP